MNKISDIDLNFKVTTTIKEAGIKFYNALEEPFKIYGVFLEGGKYHRLPYHVAEKVNKGVKMLHANTLNTHEKCIRLFVKIIWNYQS